MIKLGRKCIDCLIMRIFGGGFSEKYRREEADMIAKPRVGVHNNAPKLQVVQQNMCFRKYCQKKFIKNKEKTL